MRRSSKYLIGGLVIIVVLAAAYIGSALAIAAGDSVGYNWPVILLLVFLAGLLFGAAMILSEFERKATQPSPPSALPPPSQ